MKTNEVDRLLNWLFGTPLILAISYVILRLAGVIPNLSLLDNIASGLIATMLGVAAGVPIILGLNGRQYREQQANESKQRLVEDRRIRDVLLGRVRKETIYNRQVLKRINDALEASNKPSEQHWDWLSTIAASFETNIYEELSRSSIKHTLEFFEQFWIEGAYSQTKRFQQRIDYCSFGKLFKPGTCSRESIAFAFLSRGPSHAQIYCEGNHPKGG